MNKKRFLISLLLLAVFLVNGTAQEADPDAIAVDYHLKGDQVFSIEAGLFIPLFLMDFSPSDNGGKVFSSTNVSLGGSGFLSYCGYLNNNIRLGGEFGGIFAYSPNDNLISMVPIMVKGAYEIYLNHRFSIPLFLSAGVSMTSYLDYFHVDPILVPGAGFYWNYNSEWSFGLKYNYWIVPQIYSNSDYNILGNFSDLKLSVEYHF